VIVGESPKWTGCADAGLGTIAIGKPGPGLGRMRMTTKGSHEELYTNKKWAGISMPAAISI